jgi:hypothetical protein
MEYLANNGFIADPTELILYSVISILSFIYWSLGAWRIFKFLPNWSICIAGIVFGLSIACIGMYAWREDGYHWLHLVLILIGVYYTISDFILLLNLKQK